MTLCPIYYAELSIALWSKDRGLQVVQITNQNHATLGDITPVFPAVC